jgi:hypothetical protein
MSRARGAGAGSLIVALLMLAGCTTPSPPADDVPQGSPGASSPPPARAAHPTDLVGMWRVTGEAAERGDAWVRFDARAVSPLLLGQEVTLWRTCGAVAGEWKATAAALVTDMYLSFGDGCASPGALAVDWLNRAEYVPTATGIDVRATDGTVRATLVDDDTMPPEDTVRGLTAALPDLTPEETRLFAPGAPLPDTATAATDVVGRWIAADETSTSPEVPFVTFHADGTYTASEGCNGAGGRWVLGDGGEFIATSSPTTLMGCDSIAIPSWVASASHIGSEVGETDAIILTLYDGDAQPLGRLASG